MDIMTAHPACGEARAEALYLKKFPDGYPCGFAWVQSYVKGNTKEGKALKQLALRRATLWLHTSTYETFVST